MDGTQDKKPRSLKQLIHDKNLYHGGRKPGTTTLKVQIKTESRADALDRVKNSVYARLNLLLTAQTAIAVGETHFIIKKIYKDAKKAPREVWERAKSDEEIVHVLNTGEHGVDYYVVKATGNSGAIDSLLDRLVGKPKDTDPGEGTGNTYNFLTQINQTAQPQTVRLLEERKKPDDTSNV